MIDSIIYGTGALIWGVLLLVAFWLLLQLGIGVVNACSVVRWTYLDATLNERKLRWHELPKFFFSHVWELTGYRNKNNLKYAYEHGSTWRGIGDWNIVKDTRPAEARPKT